MDNGRRYTYLSLAIGVLCTLTLLYCGANQQSIRDFTPKQLSVMAMQVYVAQYDDYVAQAARSDLHEAQKEVLRKKKEALMKLHSAIKLYDGFTTGGQLPPADVDKILNDALTELLNLIGGQ